MGNTFFISVMLHNSDRQIKKSDYFLSSFFPYAMPQENKSLTEAT